jgi:hypothetical protein
MYNIHGSKYLSYQFTLSLCQNIDIAPGKLTTSELKYSSFCMCLLEAVHEYPENSKFFWCLCTNMPFFMVSY